MEIIMCIVIGFLFFAAVYLMLSRNVLRIILGTALLSHGAHLLILTMGGLGGEKPPVLKEGVTNAMMADPLPQALILTAIVISFGVTALLLVIGYRTYQTSKTDRIDELKEEEFHE